MGKLKMNSGCEHLFVSFDVHQSDAQKKYRSNVLSCSKAQHFVMPVYLSQKTISPFSLGLTLASVGTHKRAFILKHSYSSG